MQLYAGLEAEIEGVVHAARALFTEKEEKKEWGFLLVDATNVFNTGNRIACLWMVRHLWPSGTQFSMKYYRHQVLLLVHANEGHAGHWLASLEGVT